MNNTDPSGLEVFTGNWISFTRGGEARWTRGNSGWYRYVDIGTAPKPRGWIWNTPQGGDNATITLKPDYYFIANNKLHTSISVKNARRAAGHIQYRFPIDAVYTQNTDVSANYIQRSFAMIVEKGTMRMSRVELLDAYKKIYGKKDILLKAFLTHRGNINPGESTDFVKNENNFTNITIDAKLKVPARAAMVLRAFIISRYLKDPELRGRMNNTIQPALAGANRNALKAMNEILTDGRRAAVADAAVKLGEYTKIALSIVNEGADIVITLNEIGEGNYKAALAFLPGISAGMLKGRTILRSGKTGKILAISDKGGKVITDARTIAKLNNSIELAAQRKLTKMTGNVQGAHFLGRHSPSVSSEALKKRATHGVDKPDTIEEED